MAWTESRVEQLRKLWAEGLSASQVAKQLGDTTRCAVISKVHREGLTRRGQQRLTSDRARAMAQASWHARSRDAAIVRKPLPPRNMHITRIKPTTRPEAKPNKFDDSPASQAALALLGKAYSAEQRRETMWVR